MPAMAIDGAEITSRVLAERPRIFSAAEALRGALNLGADLLLPPVCIFHRSSALLKARRASALRYRRAFTFGRGNRRSASLRPGVGFGALFLDHARPDPELQIWGRHEGVPLFGRWMAAAGAELLAGADVIVPVPLYRSRLWSRRFNQSAMLAQEVGKLAGVPVDCFLLARVKRTQAQVGLTAAQRRKNVAGAFRLTAAKGALREKRIVVVDDVITTGATAEACARVLKRAGAARVDILALARAVEPSALLL